MEDGQVWINPTTWTDVGLMENNSGLVDALGSLFTWKSMK